MMPASTSLSIFFRLTASMSCVNAVTCQGRLMPLKDSQHRERATLGSTCTDEAPPSTRSDVGCTRHAVSMTQFLT